MVDGEPTPAPLQAHLIYALTRMISKHFLNLEQLFTRYVSVLPFMILV
jgi:hypothetical protein